MSKFKIIYKNNNIPNKYASPKWQDAINLKRGDALIVREDILMFMLRQKHTLMVWEVLLKLTNMLTT